MSSQFVTPSANDVVQVKQEPVDITDYQTPTPVPIPPPTTTLPPPLQLPISIVKYSHLDVPRCRTYDKPYNCCEVCQGEFSDQELLLQHKLLHFNTSHVCYICDYYFVNTSTLIMHIATNHGSLNPAMVGRNDPDRSFVCSICLQRFSSNKTLLRHQDLHKQQDELSYGCKICGLDFIGYRALVAHLNATRHKEMKIKIQSIFVCVDCRSVFPSRDSYAMHMMLRAQNETCSNKCAPDSSNVQSPKMLQYLTNPNGWGSNSQSESTSQNSETSPLNLSMSQNPNYKILTCCKCGETVCDEEALALHLMVHVRESAAKPFFGRTKHRQTVKEAPNREERPESAPANEKAGTEQLTSDSIWTCHLCSLSYHSCDLLALHMIDHQTSLSTDNNNKVVLPHKESTDIIGGAMEALSSNVVSRLKAPPEVMVPRHLPPDQTCFSERSTPVTSKRKNSCSSPDNEGDRPKRCRSLGSSLFYCLYCTKQFISKREKNAHVINEHGASLKAPQCLACNSVFLQHHSLKRHLNSNVHYDMMKLRKTSCRFCDFVATSDAHILEHEGLHDINSVEKKSSLDSKTAVEDLQLPPTQSTGKLEGDKPGCEVDITTSSVASAQPADSQVTTAPSTADKSDEAAQLVVSSSSRRSKRKPRISSKFIQSLHSPCLSENDSWFEDSRISAARSMSVSPRQAMRPLLPVPLSIDPSSIAMNLLAASAPLWPNMQLPIKPPSYPDIQQQPATTTSDPSNHPPTADHDSDTDLIDYVLSNSDRLSMCKYCKIIYTDQTMYYLHMGLHNLNNPWQCNLCGKVSRNVHEFTSHVIHY